MKTIKEINDSFIKLKSDVLEFLKEKLKNTSEDNPLQIQVELGFGLFHSTVDLIYMNGEDVFIHYSDDDDDMNNSIDEFPIEDILIIANNIK